MPGTLAGGIASPVRAGTTAVYLFEDSGRLAPHLSGLETAFKKLLADHKTTPDLRVLALKHGGNGRPLNRGLSQDWRDALGNPGLFNPYMLGFKTPVPLGSITDDMVTGALNRFYRPRGSVQHPQFLYPGIDKARKKIEDFCAIAANAPSCRHKVIVVLSNGIPGKADCDYFDQGAKRDGVHDDLPEPLLDNVRKAGIELHTLCIGAFCQRQVAESPPPDIYFYYHARPCTWSRWSPCWRSLGYRGGDLLEQIAQLAGGTFHGWVP